MSKLHILGPDFSTFLRSVRLYCEELGLNYTYGPELNGKIIPLKSNELAQYHPFKKVPVLFYDEKPIFETTTICRFLDNISPTKKLLPKDPLANALIDQWSGALSTYIDNILVRQYVLEFAFPKGPNNSIRTNIVEKLLPDVIEILNLLDKQLSNNTFFCGNTYSMADAILTPMLDYVVQTPYAEQLFINTPNLITYLTRMKERPSGKTVFNK